MHIDKMPIREILSNFVPLSNVYAAAAAAAAKSL